MAILSVLPSAAYRALVLIILACLLVGATYAAYYWYDQSLTKEAEKQSVINLYANQPATRTVDKQGRETVKVLTPVIPANVLKDLKSGFAAEIRDQLRKSEGRTALLLQAQRTQTVTQQVLPTVALRDTTMRTVTPAGIISRKAKAGSFKDEWLTLTGIVTDDSLSVKYNIKNDFDIYAYSKKDQKHWWQFWKPRKVYVNLKNKNPNTTTTGIDAVVVEKQ